jgi:hypothetical protein
MTKYVAVAAALLLNNEIVSLIALAIIVWLFLADVLKALVNE